SGGLCMKLNKSAAFDFFSSCNTASGSSGNSCLSAVSRAIRGKRPRTVTSLPQMFIDLLVLRRLAGEAAQMLMRWESPPAGGKFRLAQGTDIPPDSRDGSLI